MSAPEWFLPFVPLPAWARDTPPADFQAKVERYAAFRQANDKDFKWDRLAPDKVDQDEIKEAAAAQNLLLPVEVDRLSPDDWAAIDKAIADGHLDERPTDAGNYPDFSEHAVVDVMLPPDLWNGTDSQQFRWLNEQLFADGGTQAKSYPWNHPGAVARDTPPHGYTWHHHQQPGRMQLVPFGVHAAVQHSGGRQVWAKGER
jgi:hypothetical protein